jgi:hypothetical protein
MIRKNSTTTAAYGNTVVVGTVAFNFTNNEQN